MTKRTKKQGKTEGHMERRIDEAHRQMDRWIEEENLKSQAKQIRARIKDTAQIAELNFWEYISGSFSEIADLHPPTEVASGFSKACCDAVTAWYIANTELDEKLRSLITADSIKAHERKAIIGQNEKGWWAANPEPAIKAQDIDKVAVIFEGMPSKDELLNLLSDLGYKKENIAEGILKL
jgi:hypothetical protein